jgi:glycosyltransferase involved in cell wall biosynthesis
MRSVSLSVVIPTYNSWHTVYALLKSLEKSSYRQFEVIVGDDASHTQKSTELLKLLQKPLGVKKVQIVRLPINRGPAAARNAAAKKARGTVLVFLDADVTVYPDTLKRIVEKFVADADLTAITGVWDKHQKTHAFFPQFKALRDWSYWTNEADRDGYYYLFSTRVAAVKRDVFVRLGGFNESFRQMEDVEITYRIAKRYAIIFAPDVRVHHEFEGFWPVARKYFWRSFYWSSLYRQRRKFDPVATTLWESLAALSAVSAVAVLGMGSSIFFFFPLSSVRNIGLLLLALLLLIHIILLRKFLYSVWQQKGGAFVLQSLGVGIVLYCVIASGAAYFLLASRLRRP